MFFTLHCITLRCICLLLDESKIAEEMQGFVVTGDEEDEEGEAAEEDHSK